MLLSVTEEEAPAIVCISLAVNSSRAANREGGGGTGSNSVPGPIGSAGGESPSAATPQFSYSYPPRVGPQASSPFHGHQVAEQWQDC